MSKIGVAVGEDFPLQDLDGLPSDPPEEKQGASDDQTKCAPGQCGPDRAEAHAQSEFARWKWHREGQRHWDNDVQSERAEWEARKRAFKDKIRAAVHNAVRANENRHHDKWRHSWRSLWPGVAGIGIAALALAIHRHHHKRQTGGCRYYNDSDIQTPPHAHDAPPPPHSGEPIVTPPPPREH